jgi:hypothetical protein
LHGPAIGEAMKQAQARAIAGVAKTDR